MDIEIKIVFMLMASMAMSEVIIICIVALLFKRLMDAEKVIKDYISKVKI